MGKKENNNNFTFKFLFIFTCALSNPPFDYSLNIHYLLCCVLEHYTLCWLNTGRQKNHPGMNEKLLRAGDN